MAAILNFIFLLLNFISNIQSRIADLIGYGHKILTTEEFLSYIDNKIPGIRYGKWMEWKECAVCLSEFEEGECIRELKCEHMFHKDCVDKWLKRCRSNCPICRSKVWPDKVVASHRMKKDDASDDEYGGRAEVEPVFLLFSSQRNFIW